LICSLQLAVYNVAVSCKIHGISYHNTTTKLRARTLVTLSLAQTQHHVHYTSTSCTLHHQHHAHYMSTTYTLHVNIMHTTRQHHVHFMFMSCSLHFTPLLGSHNSLLAVHSRSFTSFAFCTCSLPDNHSQSLLIVYILNVGAPRTYPSLIYSVLFSF